MNRCVSLSPFFPFYLILFFRSEIKFFRSLLKKEEKERNDKFTIVIFISFLPLIFRCLFEENQKNKQQRNHFDPL
jgi:hypothetical protein